MEPRRYGPFRYPSVLKRPPIAWPGGARVALWIAPNVEFFPLNEPVPFGTTLTDTFVVSPVA